MFSLYGYVLNSGEKASRCNRALSPCELYVREYFAVTKPQDRQFTVVAIPSTKRSYDTYLHDYVTDVLVRDAFHDRL
jgi:hypothetical protein